MPLTFQTTEFQVISGKRKLVRFQPFLRMTKDGQDVYIQNGQVYAGGAERLNNLPDWFQDELKKQNPEALDQVGWTEHRKVGRPASKETLEKKLSEKEPKGFFGKKKEAEKVDVKEETEEDA